MGQTSGTEVLAVRVRALVAPALAGLGLELWDVESGPSSLRILVERPGGVDLEALSAATEAISPLLDAAAGVQPEGSYSLEVSSPGIERTLRTLDQYRRYLGEVVSVKTAVAVNGSRRHMGKLVGADEAAISVQLDSGEVVQLPLECVERTRTVLVWGPAPKPSPSRASKPTASQGVTR
ncbi:MAG: ribosome maturation factor RimP [Acidimicrobiales bacterium]